MRLRVAAVLCLLVSSAGYAAEKKSKPHLTPAPHPSALPVEVDVGNTAPPIQGAGFTIESIQGAETVTVTAAGGGPLEVKAGEKVQPGSRVKLGPGASATLLYADGARVELSSAADFEAGEKIGGLQTSHLHAGKAVGRVPAPKPSLVTGQSTGADPKKKIRFLIRTRSAVMGVRGTVFEVLMETAENARFETLEGTIEVAKDQSTLLSAGGVEVPAGQFVSATPSGITAPQAVGAAAPPAANPVAGLPAEVPVAAPAAPPAAPGVAEWLPKPHLFAFEGGVLISKDPRSPLSSGSTKPAPFISWKPGFGLPKLDFIRVRAHLGFAKRDGINIRETGVFITGHILGIAFAELGWGDEVWLGTEVSGGTFSQNLGLLIGTGLFERIFVGHISYKSQPTRIDQWRVGIGLSI